MGGETLGFPNWFPFPQGSIWGALLPVDPSCEFGPCVPITNDYLAGVRRCGLDGAQYTFVVNVFLYFGGDFWFDSSGNPYASAHVPGATPTNIEFDVLLGGFYLSRINSNPFLRIGPGYVKGGRRIFRIVTGGPGVGW